MQSTNRVRKKKFLLWAVFLLVAALTACGNTDASEGDEESRRSRSHTADIEEGSAANDETDEETDKKTDEGADGGVDEESDDGDSEGTAGDQQNTTVQMTSGEQTVDPLPEMTEEERAALQYVEKIILEDYYGDKTEYEVYVPKDVITGDGFAFINNHGLYFYVTVFNGGSDDRLDNYLNNLVQTDINVWGDEDTGYWEAEFGEMIRCGDDRFRLASAMREDFSGIPYAVKKIYFMDVLKEGVGVIWTLEVSDYGADDVTDALIDEIAKCYRIDLGGIKPGDTWSAGDAKRNEQQQDEYEPLEGVEKLEGYQYMGLTVITDYSWEQIPCPIMIPLGRRTYVGDSTAWADMHGVGVSGNFGSLHGSDFLTTIQSRIDSSAGTYERLSDTYANVRAGSAQSIPGYDMASCAAITYEEVDYLTGEFLPRVDVICYIRVQEDYLLTVTITLSFEEYDGSTNTLLKELETAYGIDLSEYYNEEV